MTEFDEAQQKALFRTVNEKLKEITGSGEAEFTDRGELKNAYASAVREVYVDSVLSHVTPAAIESAMNSALKNVN